MQKKIWQQMIVLIFSDTIFGDFPENRVVHDLADRQAAVDADRVNGVQFERPIATETDVAKTRSHVDEQPEASNRRTPFQ